MKCILPIIFILIISSCASNETADSSDVTQSEIYQTYRVNWDGDQGSVTASFRFGGENGTTLRLSDPSKITYNGLKLTEAKFLFGGAFYEGSRQGYAPEHVFQFTDSDGKVYENIFEFEPIDFVNPPKKLLNNADLELTLSRKIGKNEVLYFNTESDTLSNQMTIGRSPNEFVYYDAGTQKLIVKPACFNGYTKPATSIWISTHEIRKPLNQPTNFGGEFHFDYKSNEVKLKRVGK